MKIPRLGVGQAEIKFPRIGLTFALLLLILTAVLLMTFFLVRHEARGKQQNFLEKGANIVGMMALNQIQEFDAGRRGVLMRTLGENLSKERFLYLLVHDLKGKNVFSIADEGVAAQIPVHVEAASLARASSYTQTFTIAALGEITEFSAPIFEKGKRTGTIRLGAMPLPVAFFSAERLSLVALMAYFIIAALILGYYGILRRLKPLDKIDKRLVPDRQPSASRSKLPGINELQNLIEAVESSADTVCSQMQQIKEDNLLLVSRLGVAAFDRRHVSSILDAFHFCIVILDTQENVTNINQAMLNLIGKKRVDTIDRPLASVIENPEILAYVLQQDNVLRTKALKPIDITLPDLAPGERFQVSLSFLTDRAQELTGKLITIRNVTAVKSAEESQQQFLAHVAHELRTPLTNIKSYSEMLMDGEVTDREMQREFYNTINAETSRLTRLIHTLLSISQIEMGSLSINRGLVRTDWFLEGCLAAIEATAKDKKLTIEKRMPDHFPSLMADKELLQGAIINILGNALKYTPENGKITFAISERDGEALFEVIDTGYGIAKEDIPHVFKKFYRSGNKEITAQTGSGLGLAITAEIVRLHGGRVDLQSELGVGTHVTIRIPKEDHFLGQS